MYQNKFINSLTIHWTIHGNLEGRLSVVDLCYDSRLKIVRSQEKLKKKHLTKEHPEEDDEAILQEHFQEEVGILAQPPTNGDVDIQCDGSIQDTNLPSEADTLQLWKKSVESSLQCLQYRKNDNLTVGSPGGSWPHCLSLVATIASGSSASTAATTTGLQCCSKYNVNGNPVVLLVAWVDPNQRVLSGRVVDVKEERILALVPARHSLVNFQSAEIILNSIHVRPHKCGPKDRPPLPDIALRCYKMWDASIARRHALATESVSLETCTWCRCEHKVQLSSSASSAGLPHHGDATATATTTTTTTTTTDVETETTEAVFTCALCLLPCHLSCSINVARNHSDISFQSSSSSVDVVMSETEATSKSLIPKRFCEPGPHGHNALCGLCEHYFNKP